MEKVQVYIGCDYKIIKSFGKYFKEGEIWHAWYYGELIFLEVKQEGKAFRALQVPYAPSRFIKAIQEGKALRVHNVTLQDGQTNWEPEVGQ